MCTEPAAIGFTVGLVEPLLFGGKALGIEQGVGSLGLAAKDMHLDKINLGQRLTDAGFLQPFLPTLKDQRYFTRRVHRHQLLQAQHPFGRVAASEAGKVDAQVAIRLFFYHQA